MTVKNGIQRNINCFSENGVNARAESKEKMEDITFCSVDVFIDKTTSLQGGVYVRRRYFATAFVKGRTSGFYFDTASGILVRNCSVKWGNNRPEYFAYALEIHNVPGLKVSSFDGESAFPKKMPAQYNR